MDKVNSISLKIQNPDKILFEGKVSRISSFNELGPFDIYPMHANFISILNKNIDLYSLGNKTDSIVIDRAILKAKNDRVDIYLGLESLLLEEEKEIQKLNN